MKTVEILGHLLNIKLSPSFMKNAKCPLYLKLHYVDRIVINEASIPAERGRTAHAVIADLVKLCNSEEMQPEDIGHELIREGLMKHTPHVILDEVDLIFEWLVLWASRYKISPHLYSFEEKIALDENFQDTEWDNGSYRGILDIINIVDELCIVEDWKSQPNILSKTDLNSPTGSDASRQLTHYCWLASKRHPDLEEFKARIWYLRYGFYHETERTLDQLDIYENALLVKERKISEIDNWDPVSGDQCNYCEYHSMCPLAADTSTEHGQLITQEQAVQAAENVTAMEAYLKSRKTCLKDYVKANDSVRTGGGTVWGFNKKLGDLWPAEDVEEVFENYGKPLSEVANIDAKKMKKVLKAAAQEEPELEAELQKVRQDKHYTKFEGYIPKD